MRVALVCDWFLKYVRPLATSLAAGGADVLLVCRDHAWEFGGDHGEREACLEALDRAGVRVAVVPGRVSEPGRLGGAARAARTLRRFAPDVVHAQDNGDPRLLGSAAGHPLVLTLHDPVPHSGAPAPSRLARAVRRAWLRRANSIIVHGARLADEVGPRVGRDRVVVVPHGTTTRECPLVRPVRRSVLLFGRLEPYKGVHVLTEAMARVWRTRPDVGLTIAGEGPCVPRLPAGAPVRVRVGYVPEAELEAAFAAASLLALPYLDASQSGVGLLAIGRGVPAVVTDAGSLPDLACRSELVCPPGDARALAGAILAHVDHGRDLREEVIAHARERFAWPVVADRTLEVYRRAAGGHR